MANLWDADEKGQVCVRSAFLLMDKIGIILKGQPDRLLSSYHP